LRKKSPLHGVLSNAKLEGDNVDRKHLIEWLERTYATAETEIDCDHVQALLPGLAEFELTDGEGVTRFPEAVAHLAQCPDCAEEYQGLREVVRLDAQKRLPSIEESLRQFEAETTLEEGTPA
jgi:hypothetical protein